MHGLLATSRSARLHQATSGFISFISHTLELVDREDSMMVMIMIVAMTCSSSCCTCSA